MTNPREVCWVCDRPMIDLDNRWERKMIDKSLSKEQLEMLKPGSTSRPTLPRDMFQPMLSEGDAKTLLCGLFPDGIDVAKLTPQARDEIRAAIEVVLARVSR